jgi:cell wall-associated NlpC family hydrolase
MVVRLIIVLFFFSVGVFSQEKFIKHKISKGENLSVIAKKYGVKTKDIEEANPDAPKVLKLNSVLLIPNTNKKVTTKKTEIVANTTPATTSNSGQHEVQEKENLWVISKKYNVSVDDLKKANPSLESEDLKIGQKLTIPSNAVVATEKNTKKNQNIEKPEIIPSTDVEVVVEVKPKETKYLIAKKYGITVAELEKQNPFIKGKLPVGYLLKIRTSKEKANQEVKDAVIASQNQIAEKTATTLENKGKTTEVKPEIVSDKNAEIVVEVKPNETKYTIAKKYGITVAELERQNPFIKGKLPVGYLLKIKTSKEKANQEIKDTAIASQTQIAENPVLTSDNKIKTDEAKPEITPAQNVEVVVEVQPKETKYAIAKKYGITVAELERQNPFIKGKLPVGYMLKINTSKEKADAASSITTPQSNDGLSGTSQVADNSSVEKDTTTVFRVSNHSDLVNQLVVNATENIGTRYRSGGTTKAGFDCSGLMICTFNNFDIKLPRSSIEQSRVGFKVGTEEAQKGDLIFFRTNGRRQINHVGMVVEVADGEIKFVHSSTHGGVIISSTKEPYYQRTFTQVNRILQ